MSELILSANSTRYALGEDDTADVANKAISVLSQYMVVTDVSRSENEININIDDSDTDLLIQLTLVHVTDPDELESVTGCHIWEPDSSVFVIYGLSHSLLSDLEHSALVRQLNRIGIAEGDE